DERDPGLRRRRREPLDQRPDVALGRELDRLLGRAELELAREDVGRLARAHERAREDAVDRGDLREPAEGAPRALPSAIGERTVGIVEPLASELGGRVSNDVEAHAPLL